MIRSGDGFPANATPSWRLWLVCLGGATLLALLGATEVAASRVVEGLPANWGRVLRTQALDWYVWALLAPSIVTLAQRWPFDIRDRWKRAATWLGLAFLFTPIHTLVEVIGARTFGVVDPSMPLVVALPARFTGTLAANLLVFTVIVLAAHAVEHYRESQARAMRESRLRIELAQAQVEVLRMQLHPHFLFNTLHLVSALMADDVPAARRMLTKLGDLLRHSLEHAGTAEVPLSDELAFLEHYLDIQRTRFGDRLAVRVGVDPDARSALVPSLLLQPLVENAIRHAIEPRGTPGTIEIQAARHGPTLEIGIRDDGPGLAGGMLRAGMGLANTRARLARLYGDQHRFTLDDVPGGGLAITIAIPYRPGTDGPADS